MRDDDGLGPTAWDLAKDLLFVGAPRLSSAWQAGLFLAYRLSDGAGLRSRQAWTPLLPTSEPCSTA